MILKGAKEGRKEWKEGGKYLHEKHESISERRGEKSMEGCRNVSRNERKKKVQEE
jgi:hypothetical protein